MSQQLIRLRELDFHQHLIIWPGGFYEANQTSPRLATSIELNESKPDRPQTVSIQLAE